jgi:hypothetical protein
MNQKKPRNAFLRALDQLFGVYDHRPKKITSLDIHSVNGMIYIGEVAYTPREAFEIAKEILRRTPM